MLRKENKPWLPVLASLIVGAFIGAAVVLSQGPQQVAISTKSEGKCVISNGNETHVNRCQIIQSGIAYIAYSW